MDDAMNVLSEAPPSSRDDMHSKTSDTFKNVLESERRRKIVRVLTAQAACTAIILILLRPSFVLDSKDALTQPQLNMGKIGTIVAGSVGATLLLQRFHG